MGFLGRVDFDVEKSPTDPVGQTMITQPGQLRYSRKLGEQLPESGCSDVSSLILLAVGSQVRWLTSQSCCLCQIFQRISFCFSPSLEGLGCALSCPFQLEEGRRKPIDDEQSVGELAWDS